MRKERSLNFSEVFAGLVISALLFLFSQIGAFAGLYSFAANFIKDFRTNVYNSSAGLSENIQFFFNISAVKDERDRLLQEKLQLVSDNTKLQEDLQNSNVINRQLQFDLPYKLEPVRVVGFNESKSGEIIISKGVDQGLKTGDAVIFDKYAVGEVTDAAKNTAIVRLINSPDSVVPVITLTSGTKGITSGDIEIGIRMKEILTDQNIAAGETVVTAGINSNYPYGLIVGKVDQVLGQPTDITKEAKITSDIKFNDLLNLFVIIK